MKAEALKMGQSIAIICKIQFRSRRKQLIDISQRLLPIMVEDPNINAGEKPHIVFFWHIVNNWIKNITKQSLPTFQNLCFVRFVTIGKWNINFNVIVTESRKQLKYLAMSVSWCGAISNKNTFASFFDVKHPNKRIVFGGCNGTQCM